ncbi:hypothetical protein BGW39_003769 [Mortierella sp. 14UC]|nr:hypothetical protein BGW39_003769 [Mortierella sp. 14UC]
MSGGFMKRQEIPADQPTTDYFNILINKNNQAIREIVDPSLRNPPPTPATGTKEDKAAAQAILQKLQDLYFSCMDEDALVAAGRQLLLDQLQVMLAPFPSATATPTADSKAILSKALEQLLNRGLSGFIDLEVIVDPMKPQAHSLQVKESKLGLPSKEYYQDVKTVQTYGNIIAQMLQIVLGEEDVASRIQPLTDADLAAIGTELSDQFDPVKSNNSRTIVQLSDLVPSLDWSLLLIDILPLGATNTHSVIVQSSAYLSQLQTILQAATLGTLRHYFTWVAIKGLGQNLGLPYRRPLQVLNAALTGTSLELQPPRWKDCVTVVNTNVGDMAGYFFVLEFFKGNSRESVIAIIDSLLHTYEQTFPTLPWLDEPTRTGALQKNRLFRKPTPVNQKKMKDPPQTVDAFFHGPTNHINFPAGILQPPFFHVENSEYLNYGAMGFAAGHEITHGFDNMGRNYDSMGRVKSWWTKSTERAFEEKVQCFVDQYRNFTIKGLDGKDYNVNGRLTLGENIADNGGLKHAYMTWQARYQFNPSGTIHRNFKLPGLEHITPDQLFFISFGRIWCSKERPEYLRQLIRGNAHPPWRWRAMGSVKNSHEFAQAFECPSGSPMNPLKSVVSRGRSYNNKAHSLIISEIVRLVGSFLPLFKMHQEAGRSRFVDSWDPTTFLQATSICKTWCAYLTPVLWQTYDLAIMEKIAPFNVLKRNI